MRELRYTACVATLDLEPRNARIPEETYLYVIARIAEGCSIQKAIAAASASGHAEVPTPSGVIMWAHSSPKRGALYSQAKRTAAELGAVEVTSIADDALDGVGDDPGVMNARIGHARLKTDARKWLASKLLPDAYGDRMQHEHSGNVTISLDTGIRRIEGVVTDAVVRSSSLLDAGPSLLDDAGDDDASHVAHLDRIAAPSVRASSLLD